MSRNHFPELNWHVLTFLHPIFTVHDQILYEHCWRCSNISYHPQCDIKRLVFSFSLCVSRSALKTIETNKHIAQSCLMIWKNSSKELKHNIILQINDNTTIQMSIPKHHHNVDQSNFLGACYEIFG